MQVRTLEVGDELVLGGDVRVAVLAVEGEVVLLEVALPEPAHTLTLEVADGRTLPRDAWAALTSLN